MNSRPATAKHAEASYGMRARAELALACFPVADAEFIRRRCLGQKQLDEAIAYVNCQKEHYRNQTTHPWLERYSEFDEGPDDHGLGRSRVPALREEGVPYDYLGDPPF